MAELNGKKSKSTKRKWVAGKIPKQVVTMIPELAQIIAKNSDLGPVMRRDIPPQLVQLLSGLTTEGLPSVDVSGGQFAGISQGPGVPEETLSRKTPQPVTRDVGAGIAAALSDPHRQTSLDPGRPSEVDVGIAAALATPTQHQVSLSVQAPESDWMTQAPPEDMSVQLGLADLEKTLHRGRRSKLSPREFMAKAEQRYPGFREFVDQLEKTNPGFTKALSSGSPEEREAFLDGFLDEDADVKSTVKKFKDLGKELKEEGLEKITIKDEELYRKPRGQQLRKGRERKERREEEIKNNWVSRNTRRLIDERIADDENPADMLSEDYMKNLMDTAYREYQAGGGGQGGEPGSIDPAAFTVQNPTDLEVTRPEGEEATAENYHLTPAQRVDQFERDRELEEKYEALQKRFPEAKRRLDSLQSAKKRAKTGGHDRFISPFTGETLEVDPHDERWKMPRGVRQALGGQLPADIAKVERWREKFSPEARKALKEKREAERPEGDIRISRRFDARGEGTKNVLALQRQRDKFNEGQRRMGKPPTDFQAREERREDRETERRRIEADRQAAAFEAFGDRPESINRILRALSGGAGDGTGVDPVVMREEMNQAKVLTGQAWESINAKPGTTAEKRNILREHVEASYPDLTQLERDHLVEFTLGGRTWGDVGMGFLNFLNRGARFSWPPPGF